MLDKIWITEFVLAHHAITGSIFPLTPDSVAFSFVMWLKNNWKHLSISPNTHYYYVTFLLTQRYQWTHTFSNEEFSNFIAMMWICTNLRKMNEWLTFAKFIGLKHHTKVTFEEINGVSSLRYKRYKSNKCVKYQRLSMLLNHFKV